MDGMIDAPAVHGLATGHILFLEFVPCQPGPLFTGGVLGRRYNEPLPSTFIFLLFRRPSQFLLRTYGGCSNRCERP